MAENGALKVNQHLQVEGFDNVYAVGDCANLNEPKLAYHAGLHGSVAATNIINTLKGKCLTSYHTGNNHHPVIFLQLFKVNFTQFFYNTYNSDRFLDQFHSTFCPLINVFFPIRKCDYADCYGQGCWSRPV